MNNGFGINFFRHNIEEDESSWCQVFAKLPFDEVELKQKGALFGVVKFEKSENWPEKDMELTAWLDTYFNNLEVGGDMNLLCNDFSAKYPEAEYVWGWVSSDKTSQVIKVCKKGQGLFFLSRQGNFVDLSTTLKPEMVLKGNFLRGDKIAIGIGKATNFDEIEKITSNNFSCGYLIIETKGEETKEIVNKNDQQGQTPTQDAIAPKSEGARERVVINVATDRYLIRPTMTQRIEMWLKKTKSLALPSEEIKARRKKMAVMMGCCFVLLLGMSLFLGQTKKKNLESSREWSEFSQPIEKMVDEAVSVAKINQVSALKMVEEAKMRFNEGKVDFDGRSELVTLQSRIDEAWSSVSGEVKISLVEVLNLNLIRAGINANKISYSEGADYTVISGDSGVVMGVNVETKAINVSAGKGAGLGWLDAVSLKKKTYVLSKGGVFVVGNESNSIIFDSAVAEPVSLSVFGSSVYVLEKSNKEIFKYSISENGFGERQRWLKDEQSISFNPIDMDIDVDIWILGELGKVERFRRGVRESYVMSGLNGVIEFSKITAEKDGDKLAMLSSKEGSIVLCSKSTGVCDKQMKNEKLTAAKDIVFGDQGRLYVLFDGTVEVVN